MAELSFYHYSSITARGTGSLQAHRFLLLMPYRIDLMNRILLQRRRLTTAVVILPAELSTQVIISARSNMSRCHFVFNINNATHNTITGFTAANNIIIRLSFVTQYTVVLCCYTRNVSMRYMELTCADGCVLCNK